MLIKQLIIVLLSSISLACAGGGEPVADDAYAGESRRSDCISSGTIRDYRVLDDANLVVTSSAKRRYHVTLMRRALGLRASSRIGFRSTSGQICAGFSEMIVDDVMGPERIRISSIRRLTLEEHEAILVRFGKMEPTIKQAPAPKEVESAEVEELD